MLAEGCVLSMGKFRHHKGLEQGPRFEKGCLSWNCVPWTLGNNCPGPRDMIIFDVFGMETSLFGSDEATTESFFDNWG